VPVREGALRKNRWPRPDILALIGIVITAIGSAAAVIAIPGLNDLVFGPAHHDPPVVPAPAPPAPAYLDLAVHVDFNATKEQSLCGAFQQPNCDDPHEYYVTLVSLSNISNTTITDIGVFIEVIPTTGYVQLTKLIPVAGNQIESFERRELDENGYANAGNSGTYKVNSILAHETNTVKAYTVFPLAEVDLRISSNLFRNTWKAVCSETNECPNGTEIVAKVIE
jgi:hypothetical protein